jgi:hypothetical protein
MTAKCDQRRFGHIRKLPSGRYQASFVGPDQHRYKARKPFDTKTFAEGWLARQREKIQLSIYNGTAWVSPAQHEAAEKSRARPSPVRIGHNAPQHS